jgi:hypothetical protein
MHLGHQPVLGVVITGEPDTQAAADDALGADAVGQPVGRHGPLVPFAVQLDPQHDSFPILAEVQLGYAPLYWTPRLASRL